MQQLCSDADLLPACLLACLLCAGGQLQSALFSPVTLRDRGKKTERTDVPKNTMMLRCASCEP